MKKYILVPILFYAHISFALEVDGITSKEIFEKLKSLNETREALASTIDPKAPITEDTFRTVCQPVGKELQRWSTEKSLKSLQISHKNRNEKHAVPADLEGSYGEFMKNSKLMEKVVPYTLEGVEGEMHLFRIRVTDSCMACHGERSVRPAFIKQKYPKDRAFDFKPGDLRGVYTVFKKTGK